MDESNPMKDVSPEALNTLMHTETKKLSDDGVLAIIRYFRLERTRFAQNEAAGKVTRKSLMKDKGAEGTKLLEQRPDLSDLDLGV